jgi:hypothetical protein
MAQADYNKVWSDEAALEVFEDVVKAAESDDDVLCLQDAIRKSIMPYSTYYQQSKDHPHLERLKKDAQAAIIRRVNRGGLTGDLVSTPAIFRMKQLGERDESDVNQRISGKLDGEHEHRVVFENYNDDEDDTNG